MEIEQLRRGIRLLRPFCLFLPIEPPPHQFEHTPGHGEQRDHEEFDESEIAVHELSFRAILNRQRRKERSGSNNGYDQLTSGGIELRMVSTLPPVCNPNMVPRS
jgi:hypothetical protein